VQHQAKLTILHTSVHIHISFPHESGEPCGESLASNAGKQTAGDTTLPHRTQTREKKTGVKCSHRSEFH